MKGRIIILVLICSVLAVPGGWILYQHFYFDETLPRQGLLPERSAHSVNFSQVPNLSNLLSGGELTQVDTQRLAKLIGRIPNIPYEVQSVDVVPRGKSVEVRIQTKGPNDGYPHEIDFKKDWRGKWIIERRFSFIN